MAAQEVAVTIFKKVHFSQTLGMAMGKKEFLSMLFQNKADQCVPFCKGKKSQKHYNPSIMGREYARDLGWAGWVGYVML